MGVGGVTVNGVDLTSKADKSEFEVEFQANRLNGICKFRFKDDHLVVGGSAIGIREQHEILVTDGGVRIFGGRIATVTPSLDGNTVYWEGKAVSFDTLLDERVIESGVRSGSRYDDDDFKYILGYHSELLTTSFVSRLRTAVLPTIDYTGMTLRKAVETLATYTTGAIYWVDQNKEGHWQDPLTAQRIPVPGFDGGVSTGWTLDGSAVVTADAGPGGTGDYALITTGNGSGRHETTRTVTAITGDRRYYFEAWLWSSVSASATVRLDWQNNSSVSQRIDTITSSGSTSTWALNKTVLTAPTNATKVVVMLGGINNFTGTVRHDNLALIGEDAAWGVDTTPNGTTTSAPYDWKEPRRATTPINRVLVIGDGITGWREHAASIAYYGGKKFEGVIEDNRVTTTDGIDTRAASLFRKYAFPSRSGSYLQTRSGLSAGTWQIVHIDQLNYTSIEFIATLRVSWLGNSNMAYQVIYGEAEEDLSTGFISAQSAYTETGSTPNVPDPPIPGNDTTAPAVPTGLTVTSDVQTDSTGLSIVRLIVALTHPSDVDYFGSWVEATADNNQAEPPVAVWTQPMKLLLGEEVVKTSFEGVAGNTRYFVRAYSVDVNGNKSAYTATVEHITGKDTVAPGVPQELVAVGGFDGVALSWQATADSDIKHYQYAVSTDGSAWNDEVNVKATVVWVPDMPIGALRYFRVRAVDWSDNASAWTSSVTATATQIGASDIAAATITAAHISAAGISADSLKAGKIVVKTTGGSSAIEVQSSGGVVQGKWIPDSGIFIYGPDPNDYATFDDAYLRFYRDGILTAEIGPDGVLADSIRLGVLSGGHNVIKNSSFELAGFSTGVSNVTFTDASATPGWKAANRTTSPDNMTEGTDLTPTTVAY